MVTHSCPPDRKAGRRRFPRAVPLGLRTGGRTALPSRPDGSGEPSYRVVCHPTVNRSSWPYVVSKGGQWVLIVLPTGVFAWLRRRAVLRRFERTWSLGRRQANGLPKAKGN